MTSLDVISAIRSSWSDETKFPGTPKDSCPEAGHCAVTALVVQRLLGGKILRAARVISDDLDYGSHYWNLLPDGTSLDLTLSQFPLPVWVEGCTEASIEKIIANGNTARRFAILLDRVRVALKIDAP